MTNPGPPSEDPLSMTQAQTLETSSVMFVSLKDGYLFLNEPFLCFITLWE